MALVSTPIASDLLLILDAGLDEYGQQVSRRRQYGDLKTSATDQDVYDAAQGIISLQEASCLAVQRVNTVELSDES